MKKKNIHPYLKVERRHLEPSPVFVATTRRLPPAWSKASSLPWPQRCPNLHPKVRSGGSLWPAPRRRLPGNVSHHASNLVSTTVVETNKNPSPGRSQTSLGGEGPKKDPRRDFENDNKLRVPLAIRFRSVPPRDSDGLPPCGPHQGRSSNSRTRERMVRRTCGGSDDQAPTRVRRSSSAPTAPDFAAQASQE